MRTTLIVKTGATGDVIRSTVLLRLLDGELYWITDRYNFSIFPPDHPGLKLIASDAIPGWIQDHCFDLVLNLEEDADLAAVLQSVPARKKTGIIMDEGRIAYTPDSSPWFDMSLLSRLGLEAANEKKKNNRMSYQSLLFTMLGATFSGETYLINSQGEIPREPGKIGLEIRSGAIWPNKAWLGFKELAGALKERGYKIVVFSQRENLVDYFRDIRSCSLIVSGDTLAMHVALAFQIPGIGLFQCTSPHEIHDYGCLVKVVSPLLEKYYYSREEVEEAKRAIPVSRVLTEVLRILPVNRVSTHKD